MATKMRPCKAMQADQVDFDKAPLGEYPTEFCADGRLRQADLKLIGENDDRINADHTSKVKARFEEMRTPEYMAEIRKRTAAIEALAPAKHRQRLLETAGRAATTAKKIAWLRREADLTVRASQGNSACGKCSSCCHMAVAITEQEAALIAKELKRTLIQPPLDRVYEFDLSDPAGAQVMMDRGGELEAEQGERWSGVRCPFLSNEPDGGCTIYATRPLACRNLVNLDKDDLLCKLVDGGKITVPYLGRVESQLGAMLVLGPKLRIADLRDWFGKAE